MILEYFQNSFLVNLAPKTGRCPQITIRYNDNQLETKRIKIYFIAFSYHDYS